MNSRVLKAPGIRCCDCGNRRSIGSAKLAVIPRILLTAAAISLLLAPAAIADEQLMGWWPAKGSVSLISLIANGAAYEGKQVSTTGIAINRFEEHMLYVGPYDADLHNTNNGIWLELDQQELQSAAVLNGRLVEVTGVYQRPKGTSYGTCTNGALVKITKIEPWNEAPHRAGPSKSETR